MSGYPSNSLNIFIGTNSFQARDVQGSAAETLDVIPSFTDIEYTVTTHLPGSYLRDMLNDKLGMAVSVSNFADFSQAGSLRVDTIKTYQHTAGKTLDFSGIPDIGMLNADLSGNFDLSAGGDNIFIDGSREVVIDNSLQTQVASALPKALGSQMALAGGKDEIFRMMINEGKYRDLAKFSIKGLGAEDQASSSTKVLQDLIQSSAGSSGDGFLYSEIDQEWYKPIGQRKVGHEILSSIFRANPCTPANTAGPGETDPVWEHVDDDYLQLKRLPQNINLQFVLKTELNLTNENGDVLVATNSSPAYGVGQTAFDSTVPNNTTKRVLILYNFIFDEIEPVAPTVGDINGVAFDGLISGAEVWANGVNTGVVTDANGAYTLSDVSGIQNIEIRGGTDQDTGEANDVVLKLNIPDGGQVAGTVYVTPITTLMSEALEQESGADQDELLSRLNLPDLATLDAASKVNPTENDRMRKSILGAVSSIKTLMAITGADSGRAGRVIASKVRAAGANDNLEDVFAPSLQAVADELNQALSASDKTAAQDTVYNDLVAIESAGTTDDIAAITTALTANIADFKTKRTSRLALVAKAIAAVVESGAVRRLQNPSEFKLCWNDERFPKVQLNGEAVIDSTRQYSITQGTYRLTGIPSSQAILLRKNDFLSFKMVPGRTHKHKFQNYAMDEKAAEQFGVQFFGTDSKDHDFVYGDVDLVCSGAFAGSVGFFTIMDYHCGCKEAFVYEAKNLRPAAYVAPRVLATASETKTYNVYQWPKALAAENALAGQETYTETSLSWASAVVVFRDQDGDEIECKFADAPYTKAGAVMATSLASADTNIAVQQVTLPADRSYEVVAVTNPDYNYVDDSGFVTRLPNYVNLAIEDVSSATVVYEADPIVDQTGLTAEASVNSVTARFSWKHSFVTNGQVADTKTETTGTFDSATGIATARTTNKGSRTLDGGNVAIFKLSETEVGVREMDPTDPMNTAKSFPDINAKWSRNTPYPITVDGTQYWLDFPMHNTGHMAAGLSYALVDKQYMQVKRAELRNGEHQDWAFNVEGVRPGKYAVITDGPWWQQNPGQSFGTTADDAAAIHGKTEPANSNDLSESAFVFEVPVGVVDSQAPNFFISPNKDTNLITEKQRDQYAFAKLRLKPRAGANGGQDIVISFAGSDSMQIPADGSKLPLYPHLGVQESSFNQNICYSTGRHVYLPPGEYDCFQEPEPLNRNFFKFVEMGSHRYFERFCISAPDAGRQGEYRYVYDTQPADYSDKQIYGYYKNLAEFKYPAELDSAPAGHDVPFTVAADAAANAVNQLAHEATETMMTASNVFVDYSNSAIRYDLSAPANRPARNLYHNILKLTDTRTDVAGAQVNNFPDKQVALGEQFIWDNGQKLYVSHRLEWTGDSHFAVGPRPTQIPAPNSSVQLTFSSKFKFPPGKYLLLDRGEYWHFSKTKYDYNNPGMNAGDWSGIEGQRLDEIPGEIFEIKQYGKVSNDGNKFVMSDVQTDPVKLGDRLIIEFDGSASNSFKLFRDEFRTNEINLDVQDLHLDIVAMGSSNDRQVSTIANKFADFTIPTNISTGTLYFNGGSITISDWVQGNVGQVEGYTIQGTDTHAISAHEDISASSDLTAGDLGHVISA